MCTNIRLTDRKLVQTANVFFLLRQSYSHKILSEHEKKKQQPQKLFEQIPLSSNYNISVKCDKRLVDCLMPSIGVVDRLQYAQANDK